MNYTHIVTIKSRRLKPQACISTMKAKTSQTHVRYMKNQQRPKNPQQPIMIHYVRCLGFNDNLHQRLYNDSQMSDFSYKVIFICTFQHTLFCSSWKHALHYITFICSVTGIQQPGPARQYHCISCYLGVPLLIRYACFQVTRTAL